MEVHRKLDKTVNVFKKERKTEKEKERKMRRKNKEKERKMQRKKEIKKHK